MRPTSADRPPAPSLAGRVGRVAVDVALYVAVAALSIAVSLWVTPMQTVHAGGQTVRVGVAAPTLSWAGPGELDLFGQRLPTAVEFVGPVRPRLELTRITLSQQLADLVGGSAAAGMGDRSEAVATLQDALVAGWARYLAWQVAVSAAVASLLLGAVAGWRRHPLRSSIVFVVVGVVFTELVNLGAIMVTAYTAPERLRQVNSLQALAGAAPGPPLPMPSRPPSEGGNRVVVIGDSTAASLGHRLVPDASEVDRACGRGVDSFAEALDAATEWDVTNMACSGATIRDGLLGPQQAGDVTVDAQLPAAVASAPSAIILSIGANDVNWSAQLRACAAAPDCGDAAQEAYFQQQLTTFTEDYYVLLTQLRALPVLPTIVVNLYYDPLTGPLDCVASEGITDAKRGSLRARLDALNTVLAQGAQTAGFAVARPNFDGHGVCGNQPYVQGVGSLAPMHPTTAGALAIALADQQALNEAGA